MSTSFFQYHSNIYCVSKGEPFLFFFNNYVKDYGFLKTVYGYIDGGDHIEDGIIAKGETCEGLQKQCAEKFGSDYKYIQSADWVFLSSWDVVKVPTKTGELQTCPHIDEID